MYYTKKIQLELKESEYNALIAYIEDYQPVSYTHLDVYKRQIQRRMVHLAIAAIRLIPIKVVNICILKR